MATTARRESRLASSGTPSAPATAVIWKMDELAPAAAADWPWTSASRVGSQAVTA